jgi:hypothetical protein
VDIEQGTECKSIVPAGGEVANFDFIVAGRLPLTPQQQTLLRTETLLVDVADGESQNEGPYQTQDDLAVTIDDVLGTGIGKLDPPASDEVERLVDVLKLLHPQLGSGGIAAEGLVTENLKEVYEYDTVREVYDQVVNLYFADLELAVQPAVVSSVA